MIETGAKIGWGCLGERVVRQEAEDRRRTLQNAGAEVKKPGCISDISPEGCKPHLPVQTGLVRGDKRGRNRWIACFVVEVIGLPCRAVCAAFQDDFWALGGHDPKQAV